MESTLALIPLRVALLCIDCEVITPARAGRCEACGSASLLSLSNVLNRERAVPPSKPSHLYAREGVA